MSLDAVETQLPDELLRLLRAPSPCFVSTLMPDGSPQHGGRQQIRLKVTIEAESITGI
jgi:hypothetical protein